MIENANASKNPATGDFVEVKKFIGVASVNIIAVNPTNDILRKYGWNIPEGAEEQNYVTEKQDANGKMIKAARVRLLAQIQDIEEKPIIALDFWCRPEGRVNSDGTKCKIIDVYGRTAWATKEEFTNKVIPTYRDGNPANISTPYRLCHSGEEELITFLFKYLNVTPLQIFDKARNQWIDSKMPGKLTIDDWKAICDGKVQEIKKYLAMQPDNRVKVVLGVRTTDDNKTYQAFLNTGYIGNGARVDLGTGEYSSARRLIDKYAEGHSGSNYSFMATPVHEWKETATDIKEAASAGTMFDDNGNFVADDDDLPFA